jgi:hypothetical protein
VQCHAAGQPTQILCDQQSPVRRGVVSGQPGKFLVEALKTQTEAKRFGVFEKKLTSLSDLGRRFGLRQGKSGIAHAVAPRSIQRRII